jgi:heme-degrading monooxygenase HmoA
MSEAIHDLPAGSVYRVDKFVVPGAARTEFLERVETTASKLRTLPGFVRHLVLEQTAGPGEFNFVTLAEWEDAERHERAKATVSAWHAETGFSPRAILDRLGIRADVAEYRRIDG